MILGSFVLFALAFPLLIFPPAAFLVWLVSVVLFFVGLSRRKDRKLMRRQERQE